jgi:heme exporter protein D
MSFTFDSWQAFFSMGGYGLFVWSAYGALMLSLAAGVMTVLRQRKVLLRSLLNDEASA